MASLSRDTIALTGAGQSSMAGRNCAHGFILFDQNRKITGLDTHAAQWLNLDPATALARSFDSLSPSFCEIAAPAWTAPEKTGTARWAADAATDNRPVLVVQWIHEAEQPRFLLFLFHEPDSESDVASHLSRLDRLATVGTLSAGLAHEVKNALVTTKTFVDLLLERNPADELTGFVRRELLHIETLLGQMLRHASLDAPKPQVINVHECLEHALRLVRHQFRNGQITLHKEFDPKPAIVNADPDQLQQVFVNLLLNAAEAMNGGGTLRLKTAVTGARVSIWVEDSGPGIQPANLDRIFEPFFTTKPEGSGLGLSMCRQILHRHGGDIRPLNHPGTGAVFQIELPGFGTSAVESQS